MEKVIAIVGVGKLGLCLALNLELVGYEVIGVDNETQYVRQLTERTLCSHEPEVNELLVNAQNFTVTTDLQKVLSQRVSVIFILVQTPSLADGSFDHSHLESLADSLISYGIREKPVTLVVGSTTMPGYCDRLAQRVAAYNYRVCYNPEFIAQGSIVRDQRYPDQVLIGEAERADGDRIVDIYRNLCRNEPTICRMSRLSAEITKLATNCFLTTKISFANAIGDLAVKAGAEPDKILQAIGADRRIGSAYLGYGFGFGGPCFPRDNRALGKFAAGQDYPLLLGEATDEINRRHLDFQLTVYLERYPPGEIILFDGVSFKKGSTLITESQQLALAVQLADAGRSVRIYDRAEVINQVDKLYPGKFELVETVGLP